MCILSYPKLAFPPSVLGEFSSSMDLLEEYYGKRSFALYALFASVPGKKVWPRVIFVTLVIGLLSLGTYYQVSKLVIERFKLRCLVDLVPTTTATVGTLLYVPYVTFATDEKYKGLLSMMQNDLREKRSEEENVIKKRYAEKARMFVKIYAILMIIAVIGMPLSGFIPCFLDLIMPLNHTRQRQFLANGNIFFDQEKYFNLIYFIQCCVVFVLCVVIGASVNMSTIIGLHICGMGAIIRHRLENITEIEDCEPLDRASYHRLMKSRLRICIGDHQNLLRFVCATAAFYDIPLTFILTGSFCTLTVSFVQVTDPRLISMKMVIFTIAQFFQLFLVSCMGQSGIDTTAKIAEDAYHTKWNIFPPNVRKMLQIMILRSSKPCRVVARGMYTLSVANFMSVIQKITSFCMVLRRCQ